jgi:hypothetical protein
MSSNCEFCTLSVFPAENRYNRSVRVFNAKMDWFGHMQEQMYLLKQMHMLKDEKADEKVLAKCNNALDMAGTAVKMASEDMERAEAMYFESCRGHVCASPRIDVMAEISRVRITPFEISYQAVNISASVLASATAGDKPVKALDSIRYLLDSEWAVSMYEMVQSLGISVEAFDLDLLTTDAAVWDDYAVELPGVVVTEDGEGAV